MNSRKSRWTDTAISDQSGKVVVITGANSGLGLESARVLAKKNAEVILACRNSALANEAREEILSDYSKAKLKVLELDLQSLQSINEFSERFSVEFNRLDVLLNNAGIMNVPFALTEDGFESQMGTNHFGHFALTGLLLEKLKTTENSRVVTVSSTGHKAGKIDFRKLTYQDERSYSSFRAYADSKLANLLFAYELQRRFNKASINSVSLAAHPGASQTNLGRHIEDAAFFKLFNPLLTKVVQGAEMGALPQLRAATDPDVWGGEYFGPDGLAEMSGYPVKVKSSKASCNGGLAKRLWKKSEELTEVKYDFS